MVVEEPAQGKYKAEIQSDGKRLEESKMKKIELELELGIRKREVMLFQKENERLQKNLDSLLKDFCAYVSSQNEEVKVLCEDLRQDIHNLVKDVFMMDRTSEQIDSSEKRAYRWTINGKPYGFVMSYKKDRKKE